MKSPLCVAGEKQTEHNVCFLPPLVLNFELPADYPSKSSPVFTLSSKWMTRAQVRVMIGYAIMIELHMPVQELTSTCQQDLVNYSI